MNEFESPTSISSNTDELKSQCIALHRQSTALLTALFAISSILTVYLYAQARMAKNDLQMFRPQASQIIEAYKKDEPLIKQLTARLAEFGRTHSDFAPILAKYQIAIPAAPAPGAFTPPAASSPKTAPAQKK